MQADRTHAPDDVIAVFAAHPAAMQRLTETTRERYLSGIWPRSLHWLLSEPDMLHDLCAVARARIKAAPIEEAA